MLAQHARPNAIRFEGKLQDDALFDRMDEMGLPGLPCCDAWQQGAGWIRGALRCLRLSPTSFAG